MRISKFTTVLRKEGVYLLHNTLANSIIRVYSSECQAIIDSIQDGHSFKMDEANSFLSTLSTQNMIVEETEDELATLNSRYFSFEKNSELYVMLIVTRRCNFRCAYCYEEYVDADMSEAVFDNTKAFVIHQIKANHYKNVYISFFGGEPTLRMELKSILYAPIYVQTLMLFAQILAVDRWIVHAM